MGYLPYTTSKASLISPTVQRTREALMANSRRLPLPVRAASVKASKAFFASSAFLVALIFWILSTWAVLTALLSMARTSIGSFLGGLYLLTPTITSAPESMWAWRLAADSSILRLGIPCATALAIPPRASTSSTMALALDSNSAVRLSMAYDPAQGSMISVFCPLEMKLIKLMLICTWKTRLFLQDKLCVTGNSSTEFGGKSDCLIKSIGVKTLCTSQGGSHSLYPFSLLSSLKSDWNTSIVVRITLLNGSASVSDQPEVWQWVRSIRERESLGVNFSLTRVDHNLYSLVTMTKIIIINNIKKITKQV